MTLLFYWPKMKHFILFSGLSLNSFKLPLKKKFDIFQIKKYHCKTSWQPPPPSPPNPIPFWKCSTFTKYFFQFCTWLRLLAKCDLTSLVVSGDMKLWFWLKKIIIISGQLWFWFKKKKSPASRSHISILLLGISFLDIQTFFLTWPDLRSSCSSGYAQSPPSPLQRQHFLHCLMNGIILPW